MLTGVDNSPEYYANHVEVSHSPHEFELVFARLNARLSEEKRSVLSTSGRLETDTLFRLVIPPSLLIDMLYVLNTQKEKYEKNFGPLLDPSNRGKKK